MSMMVSGISARQRRSQPWRATKACVEQPVERRHGQHVDHDDVGGEERGGLHLRWPSPGTPKISAATTAIQAWPSAVRRPTRMPGVAAGSRILTRRWNGPRKPKAWATSTRSRSTPRTAPWVAKNTIQNTPTAMMNTAAEGSTPNQMMAKGTRRGRGSGAADAPPRRSPPRSRATCRPPARGRSRRPRRRPAPPRSG